MKDNIIDFIKWMFEPEHKLLVKNASGKKIADIYNSDHENKITPTMVNYHKNHWILIDGEPYYKDKLPMHIIQGDKFKEFAKNNDISIEDL